MGARTRSATARAGSCKRPLHLHRDTLGGTRQCSISIREETVHWGSVDSGHGPSGGGPLWTGQPEHESAGGDVPPTYRHPPHVPHHSRFSPACTATLTPVIRRRVIPLENGCWRMALDFRGGLAGWRGGKRQR